MTSNDTDPVVRLWQGLWIDGDDSAVVELLADPYVRHTTDGVHTHTPADYARHVCHVTRHIKGTGVTVDHLSHVDDITHARFTLTGVELTTGEPVSIGLIAQYRTEAGRLAESWSMRQTDFAWAE